MSRTDADVAIQGAGMVGLLLAAALARHGLRVMLLDKEGLPQWQAQQYGQRVCAINLASERLLRVLGVWEALQRVSPFRAIRVWDALGGGQIAFDAADLGEPHLGHIVENDLIRSVLHQSVRAARGVQVRIPVCVQRLEPDDEAVTLRLSDGTRVTVALVVGADGARSAIRELLGIPVRLGRYAQKAIVAPIRTEMAHEEIARQWFLPGGPLAFLPLADGRCSIVWSLPTAEAEARLALDEAAFCRALAHGSAGGLGSVLEVGERGAFPLYRLHAARYCTERAVLVGDAAHVIHPLAGQGVNQGFQDAAVLAKAVIDAQRRGRDIGGRLALRRYERARRGDNLLMEWSMEGFHQLFTRRRSPLVRLRSLGLGMTHRSALAKRFFMRRAIGADASILP
ncbi:MAG: UbiH/UbiF/VisC/COQ6 family ubiquinone biosynthesis hydroxylase [Nitrococcus mobilis]|nr:UbiH/UbiF/VisC/COQ6 family ubiquinone biosynthesis hydroxylase [Nitrococcus mobilis]